MTSTFALASEALSATVNEEGNLTGCPLSDSLLATFDGRVRSWMTMGRDDLVASLEGYRRMYLNAVDAYEPEIAGIFYDFKEWAHACLYVRFGYTL